MRSAEPAGPVPMERAAVLAPTPSVRDVLVGLADAGVVALDRPREPAPTPAGEALRRLEPHGARPVLAREAPDLAACAAAGRADVVAGEAELEAVTAQAVVRGGVAAWVGWTPRAGRDALAARLAPAGGAVVPLPRPTGVEPPTLLRPTARGRDFAPLVQTYATVPYADVDPSVLAGLAYVVMFGMMFADAGHGALLLAGALAVRSGRPRRLAALRPYWRFLAGAGAASVVFGLLYGEMFGPTGVLPVLWLSPLEEPLTLLAAAIAFGGVLLGGAYALGAVNRYREGGWRLTLYAPTGVAGATVFVGLALVVTALTVGPRWLLPVGAALGGLGLVASFLGLQASLGGGPAAGAQAGLELVNLVLRLGSNLVSFTRLAAFGLTHAALGAVVWQATTSLAAGGAGGLVAAVLVFLLGNALTFVLEGVVAAIQALRLEYFELFSRVFTAEGRPFRPWHVPLLPEEVPCPRG